MRIRDWSSDVCSSDLRFGEQGLASSWRTIEQEAFGRPDTNAAECVGIFEGQLHSFPQPHTGFIQAADVIPTHIGHLHHHFTHGRRLNALQCIKEILPRYAQLVEHLGSTRALFYIYSWHNVTTRFSRCLSFPFCPLAPSQSTGRAS